MTRSQRQRRTMAALLCAILAIGAAIAAALYWPQSPEDESAPLINAQTGDIESFAITYGGETISFSKDANGDWISDQMPDFPVGGSYIDSMIESFADITPNREFTLEESAVLDVGDETLRLSAGAGESGYEIIFYSLNQQTLNYYARVNNTGVVYTVSNTYADPFKIGLYDVAELENAASALSTELSSLTVELPEGGALELYYQADGLPEIDYTASAVWFYSLNGGELRPADSIAATAVLDAFQNIANERLASYNVTAAELEDYGLTGNYIKVTMVYTPNGEEEPVTVVRRFASYSAGDYATALTEGSANAYFVDRSLVQELIESVGSDLEPHSTLGIELYDITGFTVRRGDHAAEYSLERSTDEEGNDVYSLYKGEDQVESADFVSLFYGLKAITPQALADSQGGVEVFSITFYTTNQSFGGITFTLREYDESFYASVMAGDRPLLLNRRTVDALIDYLNAL